MERRASEKTIIAFVEKVTKDGSPDFVPPAERIAVFDNDGKLDKALDEAAKRGWIVADMKTDWSTVYPE